jgi:hypothetical protein
MASSRRATSGYARRAVASPSSAGNTGAVANLKGVAVNLKGPAVAVGATAVGVVGGLILKGRQRQKTILGLRVPSKPQLSNVDVKAVARSVGKASKQFGETTKQVSKDIERVGNQAERIGNILS